MAATTTVGRVTAYAAARLVPKTGNVVSAETLYLDYMRWCAIFRRVPLRDGVFREQMARLAVQIGLRSEANDADRMYRDVALREEPPKPI